MNRDLRIRMLLEAADRVSKPLRDMAAGSSHAARELKTTRDRLAQLQAAQNNVGSFRVLKKESVETARALTSVQTRIGELAVRMKAGEGPSRKLTAEMAKVRREEERLKTTHADQARELGRLREQLGRAGISTTSLREGERRLRSELSRTTPQIEEQTRRLQRLADRERRFSAARAGFSGVQDRASGVAASGAAGIASAVAVAAPLVASARGAMGLEEAIAGVAKVTGLSGASLEAMTNQVVDLSTRIPMTASELANIAAAAGAAGVGMDEFGRALPSQRQDLVTFTDAAARMGIAFDMTAEDAGATMAKWRQAFKMTQPEVEALGDRVNALTNKFGGKAADVSDIVTRIGPLGKVAGIAAPQISALASSLNSIGVENEIAATGIKNTLLALTKGEAATRPQSKAFQSLGLDAVKVAKAMQMDASGTIVDVFGRIGKLDADKRAGVLTEIFGSESIAAIAPLLTNLDGLQQRLGLVGDRSKYAGSMTQEFQSRIGTTQGATDLAVNGLQAVNIALGKQLLPIIKTGARWIAGIAGSTRRWAQQNPVLAKGVMLALGVLAALFAILGTGAIALAALMTPIALINAGLIAMGVAGGLASVGLLPIIATVGAIVLAIAALAGAAYLIYNNWSAISQFFTGLWTSVTGIVKSIVSDITTAFDGGLWGVLAMLARWSATILATFFTIGTGGTQKLVEAIGAGVSWAIGVVPSILGGLVDAIKFVIWNGLLLIPRLAIQFGVNTVQGFLKGMFSAFGALKNGITSMAGNVVAWFKEKLGIHSPSRVFMGLGGFVTQGLANGIAGGQSEPLARIRSLSADLTKALAVGVPAASLVVGSAGAAMPAGAAPGAAGAAGSYTMNVSITINAAPGQDPKEIADAVADVLRRRGPPPAGAGASFDDAPDWS